MIFIMILLGLLVLILLALEVALRRNGRNR